MDDGRRWSKAPGMARDEGDSYPPPDIAAGGPLGSGISQYILGSNHTRSSFLYSSVGFFQCNLKTTLTSWEECCLFLSLSGVEIAY